MLHNLQLVITGTIIALSVFYRYTKVKKTDYLDPFFIVAGVSFLVQVLAPLTWIHNEQLYWFNFPVIEYLPKANVYFLIGYISFCFAYFIPNIRLNKYRKKKNYSYDNDKIIKYIWFFYFSSLALYFIYLDLRGMSIISQLTLGQMGDFNQDIMMELNTTGSSVWFLKMSLDSLVFSTLALITFNQNKNYNRIAYFLTLLLVVSSGWRYLMMVMVMTPIVVKYRKSGKRLSFLKTLFIVIVLFIFAGYIGSMRDIFRGQEGKLQSFNLEKSIDAFMVNINVFHSYYAMTNFVPVSYKYVLGKSYLAIFTMFVPRVVWPNKPLPPTSELLKSMYGDYALTGPAFPIWGEFYLNFGLIGIILGMFILGVICKKIYIASKSNDSINILAFSIFLPYLFQILTRGNAPGIAVGLFFMFGPLYFIKKKTRVD